MHDVVLWQHLMVVLCDSLIQRVDTHLPSVKNIILARIKREIQPPFRIVRINDGDDEAMLALVAQVLHMLTPVTSLGEDDVMNLMIRWGL